MTIQATCSHPHRDGGVTLYRRIKLFFVQYAYGPFPYAVLKKIFRETRKAKESKERRCGAVIDHCF